MSGEWIRQYFRALEQLLVTGLANIEERVRRAGCRHDWAETAAQTLRCTRCAREISLAPQKDRKPE